MNRFQKRFLFILLITGLSIIAGAVFGEDAKNVSSNTATFDWGLALGILGAATATFLGGCGSAAGLGVSGQAAAGALSEDPNKFGIVFPIQALPGTQGIYALLIGFLILVKIGVLGTPKSLSIEQGLYAFFCGLPVGIAGLVSGYWQGVASAASIQLVSRKPSEFGKAIIGPALVETYAVFGLLLSFMMWMRL